MAFFKKWFHYSLWLRTDKKANDAKANVLKKLMQEKEHPELEKYMLGLWQQYRAGEDFNYVDWNSMFDRIMQNDKVYPIEKKRKVFSLIKVAAAAAVLVFFGLAYLFLFNVNKGDTKLVQNATNVRFKTDIVPAHDKAILTLSDGSTIILDSAENGSLTTQGNVQVKKINGELSYNFSAISGRQAPDSKKVMLYNTINTAKGKQYAFTLIDGTKVWLNAGSSLRFPVSFIGAERIVELTGEGYFEVAKNAAKPFHVKANDLDVQVIGTHFNINAYNDEATIKTTLLEGSVKIIQSNHLQMLSPGQQAQVTKDRNIKLVKDANTDQAVAWMGGFFDFDNDELPHIMRQLSRWYDINVVYNGPVPAEHYSGAIRRQLNLSEVLKMLEALGGVEFSIDGKKIFVKKK